MGWLQIQKEISPDLQKKTENFKDSHWGDNHEHI